MQSSDSFDATKDSARTERNPWPWWLVFLFASCGVIGLLDRFHSRLGYVYFLLPLLTLIFISAAKGARRSIGRSLVSRLGFWVTTLAVSWLLGVSVAAYWSGIVHSLRSNSSLLIAMVVSLLLLTFLWWRRDRTMRITLRQQGSDLLSGAVALLLVLVVAELSLNVRASHREQEAAQLWASAGRPMDEFGKRFQRMEENETLRLVATDLAPFELQMYRTERQTSTSDRLEIPEIWDLTKRPEDTVASVANVTNYFAKRRQIFDRLYSDLLSHEPPRWAFHPDEMRDAKIPNFLMLRKVAQVMNADALEHVRCGDQTRAGAILSGGLHLSEGARKHPSLVSQMICLSLESLLIGSYARIQDDQLPDYDTLTGRNREVLCEELRNCFQAFAFLHKRELDQANDQTVADIVYHQVHGVLPVTAFTHLPRWITRPFLRIEVANTSICVAKVLIPTLSPDSLSKFASESNNLDALPFQYPTASGANFRRAWFRGIASLLLREQAELIRRFRKEVAVDQPARIEEVASKILPGKTWICLLDAERHSVKILMKNVPKPISDVAPDEFFMTPLNGTVAWIYSPNRSVAEEGNSDPVAQISKVQAH